MLQGSASNYVKISLLSLLSLSPNLYKECIHFEGNMFRVDGKTIEEFSWLLLLFTAFPKYYLMNTKHVHHKKQKRKTAKAHYLRGAWCAQRTQHTGRPPLNSPSRQPLREPSAASAGALCRYRDLGTNCCVLSVHQ